MNYYNEHDPKAAAWLRELIRCGHIPPGDVDERSITDVRASDLRSYRQRHFFAGVGGWALALRLAGVSPDDPADTGSCPCQPFSQAGAGLGVLDPRHLWPYFFNLLRELGSARVYGEQVASPAALAWLDGVFADLEGAGYACGASDLCSAGAGTEGFGWILRGDSLAIEPILIGSPNIRQRLYWLAVAASNGRGEGSADRGGSLSGITSPVMRSRFANNGDARGLADPGHTEWRPLNSTRDLEGKSGEFIHAGDPCRPWDSFDILACTDGKARRIEPGTFPLAHGVPGRVGLLRGYGNAINPWLAAEFIKSTLN